MITTIREYLLIHQPRLKTLCKKLTKRFEKELLVNPAFSDEIHNQYVQECKKIFVDEITKNLACSSEDAIMAIENVDIEGFLE